MQGRRKFFDRSLYEENDRKAKDGVKSLFSEIRKKFTVEENPKKRGVDMLIYRKGEHVLNVEAEVKRVWKPDEEFPYDTIQFPERKAKFAKLEKPTLFVMFNADLSKFIMVEDKTLLKSPLKEVPNKFMYSGEYFFQVPKEKVFTNLNKALKSWEIK